MGQQIHLGVAYQTGRVVTEEEFRKLAYKSVKNRLGFSTSEKECEYLFNLNYADWYGQYKEKISEFIGLSDDDEIDLGPDLKLTPFYKYVNRDDRHVWLGVSGTWLPSDIAEMADVLGIPYCSTISIPDDVLDQIVKVFNYYMEPAAWNKAAEKMFLGDNPYFERLDGVAPYNFWRRFDKDKPKAESVDRKDDDSDKEDSDEEDSEEDEEESEEEEYEYDPEEDYHLWGIKTFMDVVSAYNLSKFSSYYEDEHRNEKVKFIASY